MADQTVKLKINGQEVTAKPGASILEAARQNGILVPHFCYHTNLPVVGNCRMCQVEVEGIPKLQISCATPVREGMSVQTENAKVLKARQGVLEFLLINHPVDCPVCDQAGECSLQDYYMKHGLYKSRFTFRKEKREKAVEIGPHVLLDQERCVLCTRCVRFTTDVTKTGELGVEHRGHHSQITLFPGKRLDNPYSGNVVDICPVGALVSKEFRFQSRVWFLRESNSVCTGCSRGCNVRVDSRNQQIFRLIPRENPEVNKTWICDNGRWGFSFVGAPDRLQAPQVGKPGQLQDVGWPMALAQVSDQLQAALAKKSGIAVIGSAQSTCETGYLLKRLAKEALGGAATEFGRSQRGTTGSTRSDDFLEEPDKNPNTRGAQELGLGTGQPEKLDELRIQIAAGKIRAAVIVDFDPIVELGENWGAALKSLDLLVVLKSNFSPVVNFAHAVLPLATFAEQEGTFVNSDGRVQRLAQAFPPVHASRIGWEALRDLGKLLGMSFQPVTAAQAFKALAAETPAFDGMTYEKLGAHGQVLGNQSELTTAAEGPVRAFGWRQWSWERKRPWE